MNQLLNIIKGSDHPRIILLSFNDVEKAVICTTFLSYKYISRIILNIFSKCISQNNLYKQHLIIDHLEKPVTHLKYLVHVSNVG